MAVFVSSMEGAFCSASEQCASGCCDNDVCSAPDVCSNSDFILSTFLFAGFFIFIAVLLFLYCKYRKRICPNKVKSRGASICLSHKKSILRVLDVMERDVRRGVLPIDLDILLLTVVILTECFSGD